MVVLLLPSSSLSAVFLASGWTNRIVFRVCEFVFLFVCDFVDDDDDNDDDLVVVG